MPAQKCPNCGAELKAGILGGLCPQCVLNKIMAEPEDSPASAAGLPSTPVPPPLPPVMPRLPPVIPPPLPSVALEAAAPPPNKGRGWRPTFVKAALAGVLLMGLIAVSIHFLGRPAHPPLTPAKNTRRPVIVTARPPAKAIRQTPVPYGSAVPSSTLRSIPTKEAAIPLPNLEGTNWIQNTPLGSKLPFYQLKITPEDLLQLERFPRSDDQRPATFVAGGVICDPVGVRDRGDWARTWSKKSLKIFFDKDKPFEKQHALNLNSGWLPVNSLGLVMNNAGLMPSSASVRCPV